MAASELAPTMQTEEKTSPSTPTPSISSQLSNVEDESDTQIDASQIPDELANGFLKFLNFDMTKEETKFNDSVELMLTKLDEFFSLVDMIRSDTSLCLQNTLPDIQVKCKEMDAVFEKIDRLEEFVNIVKETVGSVEEKVNKAESELGAVGGFIKKLSSFISKKPSPALTPARNKGPEYIPPEIFSTKDYFDHSMDTETQVSNAAASPVQTASLSNPNTQDKYQAIGDS